MSGVSLRDDPVWQRALEWRRRLTAAPEDQSLHAEHARWLGENPAHAEAQMRLETVWRLSGRVPSGTVVPFPRRRSGRRLSWAAVAMAACLALAVMPRLWPGGGADYHTAIGETRRLTLSDGSVVHLDGASAIDVAMEEGQRMIALRQGQAFFEVTPDRARPFTVSAGEVRVTVVGTAFDVRRGDDAVLVAVRSGAVRVASAGREVLLAPGDQLVLDTVGGNWTRSRVEPALVASWRDGRLAVDGVAISEVVEELRSHHTGLILLDDAELGRRRVSGVYDLSDPMAALRAAVHPHGGVVRDWPLVAVVSRR